MYKIVGTDQKEYGPISAETLNQWIADRRLNAQTLVKPEGAVDWKPLAQFPEFATALGRTGSSPAPAGLPTNLAGGPPGPHGENKTMAITSLVLGILSFVGFCFLTGIPAIITGHIARNRATKMPATYGGAGMALGGLIMGYCSLALIPVVAVLAGLMLPALAKAKARAQEISCVNNMKQIALAARLWSTDHNDVFPPDFLTMSKELNSTKILVCPADPARTGPQVSDWSTITKENITYEFVAPGIKEDSAAASKVVFRCPIHGSVAFGDGSVRTGRNGRPPPGY